ncbi:hypothetical protein [Ralstonia chuxiongensis]|uniref:hypothetical protein n=1 Tax=Ralstonia chuxiongensis TaxID=2957504 RepID=UPI0028F6975D|nr:hypothetical protein [Ralstonia chuxiongensis]CAJ0777734.1 hypothetical protein R8510_04403 [Ralstonia chuxiongensis]
MIVNRNEAGQTVITYGALAAFDQLAYRLEQINGLAALLVVATEQFSFIGKPHQTSVLGILSDLATEANALMQLGPDAPTSHAGN